MAKQTSYQGEDSKEQKYFFLSARLASWWTVFQDISVPSFIVLPFIFWAFVWAVAVSIMWSHDSLYVRLKHFQKFQYSPRIDTEAMTVIWSDGSKQYWLCKKGSKKIRKRSLLVERFLEGFEQSWKGLGVVGLFENALRIQIRQLRVQGVLKDSWLSFTNSPSYFLGAICPISKQFPKPTKLGQFNVAK